MVGIRPRRCHNTCDVIIRIVVIYRQRTACRHRACFRRSLKCVIDIRHSKNHFGLRRKCRRVARIRSRIHSFLIENDLIFLCRDFCRNRSVCHARIRTLSCRSVRTRVGHTLIDICIAGFVDRVHLRQLLFDSSGHVRVQFFRSDIIKTGFLCLSHAGICITPGKEGRCILTVDVQRTREDIHRFLIFLFKKQIIALFYEPFHPVLRKLTNHQNNTNDKNHNTDCHYPDYAPFHMLLPR